MRTLTDEQLNELERLIQRRELLKNLMETHLRQALEHKGIADGIQRRIDETDLRVSEIRTGIPVKRDWPEDGHFEEGAPLY